MQYQQLNDGKLSAITKEEFDHQKLSDEYLFNNSTVSFNDDNTVITIIVQKSVRHGVFYKEEH